MTEQIDAKDAKRAIQKMLMGNGGSATVTIATSTRVLSLRPGDRPLITLPWPLKLAQPRTFTYRVYENNQVVEETTFERGSLDFAIAKFLNGTSSDDYVSLRPE